MVLLERMMNHDRKDFYYSNPYIKTWETEVIETRLLSNGYALTLKHTAFYPEGGGQPSDYGNIAGIDVKDVYEENGETYIISLIRSLNKRTSHVKLTGIAALIICSSIADSTCFLALLIDTYDIYTVSFHLGSEASLYRFKCTSVIS